MNFEDRFFAELKDVQDKFRRFSIIPKRNSVFCKVIHWVLWALTWGHLDFLHRFHSTFGKTLYVAESWDHDTYGQRWVTLKHERVHLEQSKRCGLGLFWVGYVVFSLLYLFCLPFGLTLRSVFELEAYKEQAFCARTAGYPVSRAHLRTLFTGPSYFWMCLSSKLVDRMLDEIPCLDP
jgi:hypothetical protein